MDSPQGKVQGKTRFENSLDASLATWARPEWRTRGPRVAPGLSSPLGSGTCGTQRLEGTLWVALELVERLQAFSPRRTCGPGVPPAPCRPAPDAAGHDPRGPGAQVRTRPPGPPWPRAPRRPRPGAHTLTAMPAAGPALLGQTGAPDQRAPRRLERVHGQLRSPPPPKLLQENFPPGQAARARRAPPPPSPRRPGAGS